ncbi:hypothetical protein T11_5570 [Trichinella zimbabwensis]|uniref:Uncharacterized protein n=1 Tax=Trichinella zimbabwensis TaxID=268475 RepID=A0A0V1G748_9BILA|nr:hypothetical protein T11_5570 [Trichinella zimbabwensis]
MPPGHRRFTFVVVCARWRWRYARLSKWRKKNRAKLRLLRNFRSFKRLMKTLTLTLRE